MGKNHFITQAKEDTIMGLFSFMYADTENRENLCIGERAYLLLPDREPNFELSYDGYWHFRGTDIYEVTVDLNRNLLTEEFLDMYIASPRKFDWTIIY